MKQYVLRRALLALPTLFLVTIIVFAMMRLMPGDVVTRMVEGHAYAPTLDALRKELGLDRPIHAQYFEWIGNIVLLILNLLVSVVLRRGKVADDDPWEAYTLEWATTSPPPAHDFASLQPIRSERPTFDLHHGREAAPGEAPGGYAHCGQYNSAD